MSPEAQRIAIAEACGTLIFEPDGDMICAHNDSFENLQESDAAFGRTEFEAALELLKDSPNSLPDYLNDLNAMHEAESYQLEKVGWEFQCGYLLNLREVGIRRRKGCNAVQVDFWLMFATAAQRAEAFLRTIGKWDDTP